MCNKFKFCFVSYFLEIFFFLNIFEQRFVEPINVKSVNIGSKIRLHIASVIAFKDVFYFVCVDIVPTCCVCAPLCA